MKTSNDNRRVNGLREEPDSSWQRTTKEGM